MIRALLDPSPDALIAKRLRDRLGRDGARQAIHTICKQFTNVELAALAARWETWARPKQLAPANWLSWGNLTARGWGKTRTCAALITSEIMAGRVRVVTMAAQNLTKTESVQVAGLIEAAPPWFRPEYESSRQQLVYPNGARAYAFTPEVPDAIRSPNANLAWLSELQSWPAATREEAYSNFVFSTRVGGSRLVWDATPKKRHPILKRLLARAEAHPTKHFVVRGPIYENPHLDKVAIETMEIDYGGTQKGREELLGEMLDDSESALVRQTWIDDARRPMPTTLERRIITVDPATTSRAGSDNSGILDLGLGVDAQLLVCGDLTGKYTAGAWMQSVISRYLTCKCDLVLIETNKGNDLLFDMLAHEAKARGLNAVRVGKDEHPHHQTGILYVKEVYGQGPKEDRAQPMATAYERGRISHVIGVDLTALEDSLTTWEPAKGMRSPDAIDAMAHGVVELLGGVTETARASAAFTGIAEMAAALTQPASGLPRDLAALLAGGVSGGRI